MRRKSIEKNLKPTHKSDMKIREFALLKKAAMIGRWVLGVN